jgi:FkbM family methyltransferase
VSLRLVTRSVWCNPGNKGQRLSRTLAAIRWQLRKRLIGKPLSITLATGARFRAYPDCVISSALIYADWPEYREIQFVRSRLHREDAVLDVGANVGHISLLLSDLISPRRLFCFEPTPFTHRRLEENWRLNSWSAENLFDVALGATDGHIRLPDVDRPEPKNSVLAAETAARTVEVPLRTLDSFRSRWRGMTVGLLKIDVEGYESQVFAGAAQVLSEDRPRLVMFESLSEKVDSLVASQFAAARYVVFGLNETGRPDFSDLSGQNLFAAPEELAALE